MKARAAVYPGTFNPWHKGHQDILEKALKVFDHVTVLQYGKNRREYVSDNYQFTSFTGKLVDAIKKFPSTCAIIRGLRNGHDLQYEMNQQYWNEDLGCEVAFVYFICDRKYSHISSSAIRELQKIESGKIMRKK